MKRITLNAVVALFVAYALLGVFAAASALWLPQGTIGLEADYGAYVRNVTPGGPADRAGIVAGDRIVLASVRGEERRYVAGVGVSVPSGTAVHFRLEQRDGTRAITLISVPAILTSADRSSLLLACVTALMFIAVAAALMSLRPTPATWGFGLYCLLELPTAASPFRLPSIGTTVTAIFSYDIVENVGVIGLLLFAVEFPRAFDVPWRNNVRRALPALFLVLSAMTLYPDVANIILARGARIENHLLQIVFGVVYGVALAVLSNTYRRVAHDERERLRWILFGFGVGLPANFIGTTLLFSSLVPILPPVWLLNALISLNVLLPLTVAHAVVRHRVLDINFVVSRALVYAALTSFIAALFGLSDWFFGSVLEDFRLSRFVEAGASICIAFAFDALHKRIECAVEAVFFVRRRSAEVRLERLARDLLQARTVDVVEKVVVDEIERNLVLTSAALFRWSDDGTFRRTTAYGWCDADCAVLDDRDVLVLSLRSNERSIRLAELPWRREDIPQGHAAPVIALAVRSRGDFAGVLLYGAHPSGQDIDPNEVALIERVARSAGIALDELEAERLRAVSLAQQRRIAELEARVDELRRMREAPSPRSPAVTDATGAPQSAR